MRFVSGCDVDMLGSLTFDTPIVGISHKPRWTKLANGLMILHYTWGVARTNLAFTWVLALQVDAGLVAWAASVLETDGDTGVASGGAHTDSLVVQHLALLAGLAGSWSVTGVDAASLVTGLVAGTLLVTSALQLTVRTGENSSLVDH